MEEKYFLCSWKVSKFLHAASFANARKVDVSEFQVKNVAIWPVTGQGFQTLNGRQSYIISNFTNLKILANLNYHMPIKTSQAMLDIACVAWRFWLGALSNKGGRGQTNREEIGAEAT